MSPGRKSPEKRKVGSSILPLTTELLHFLTGWLSHDPARLAASLEGYVGNPAYGATQLRENLDRFTFLLGGSDGESLFGP
jgi:hypothetical protein